MIHLVTQNQTIDFARVYNRAATGTRQMCGPHCVAAGVSTLRARSAHN